MIPLKIETLLAAGLAHYMQPHSHPKNTWEQIGFWQFIPNIPIEINHEIYERLARIEEKIDGLGLRFGERLATVEARISGLEKSSERRGERLGRLEAAEERRRGGFAVLAIIWAAAAAIGGMLVRYLWK